jgi:hypothetical protein
MLLAAGGQVPSPSVPAAPVVAADDQRRIDSVFPALGARSKHKRVRGNDEPTPAASKELPINLMLLSRMFGASVGRSRSVFNFPCTSTPLPAQRRSYLQGHC